MNAVLWLTQLTAINAAKDEAAVRVTSQLDCLSSVLSLNAGLLSIIMLNVS